MRGIKCSPRVPNAGFGLNFVILTIHNNASDFIVLGHWPGFRVGEWTRSNTAIGMGMCCVFVLYDSKQTKIDKNQNTWNSFACSMNETVILEAAERIVSLGFKDLGYEYVVMDDCWSAGRNSSGYLIPDPQKFPNGIADVANKIHAMGLKLGIYSSAGTLTCARYSGSLGYEEKDATLWASWGVSFLFRISFFL